MIGSALGGGGAGLGAVSTELGRQHPVCRGTVGPGAPTRQQTCGPMLPTPAWGPDTGGSATWASSQLSHNRGFGVQARAD